MADRAPLLGAAALLAALAIASLAGSAVGVGPLAPTTPPDKVTDPREMIARSLQAVLDADAVHLAATVDGLVPGAVVGRDEHTVTLDGTATTFDIRPKDAKTRTRVDSPALGVTLDAVTAWDGAWYRTSSDVPWHKDSLGALSAGSGIDINPLTFVDRLRGFLARDDVVPEVTDIPCAGASGRCHRVVLDAGTDPAAILGAMLPGGGGTSLPPARTSVTLATDAQSLRPVRLELDVASGDGTLDLRVVVDASDWDGDIRIEEPPAGS